MKDSKPWRKLTEGMTERSNQTEFDSRVNQSVLKQPNPKQKRLLSQSEYKDYLVECAKNLEEGRIYEEIAGNGHRKIVTCTEAELEALSAFRDATKGLSQKRQESYHQMLMEDCREIAAAAQETGKDFLCFSQRESAIIALVQGVLNMGIFESDVRQANASANCTMDTPVEKLAQTSRVALYHANNLEFIYENWLIKQPDWQDKYEICILR